MRRWLLFILVLMAASAFASAPVPKLVLPKLYGPDFDRVYGWQNGTGGFEADAAANVLTLGGKAAVTGGIKTGAKELIPGRDYITGEETSRFWAAVDVVGLAYDITATAVPFLPAGVSAAVKAARAGNTVVDSVNAGLDVARVAESTHQTAKTFDAVSTVPWRTALDGTKIHRQVAFEVGNSLRYFDATSMAGARGLPGRHADMIGYGVWADITTPRQWQAHVSRYAPDFGVGIPILYERGVGVVGTTRLLPAAGVGLSVLQGATGQGGAFSWLGGWASGTAGHGTLK